MSYLLFIKTAYTPGHQPITAPTEPAKLQPTYSVTTLTYVTHVNAQTAPVEPAKLQTTYAVTGLTYA